MSSDPLIDDADPKAKSDERLKAELLLVSIFGECSDGIRQLSHEALERIKTLEHGELAARYVIGELLGYIDMDQGFNNWTKQYRKAFPIMPTAFPTLHDGLIAFATACLGDNPWSVRYACTQLDCVVESCEEWENAK